MNSGTGRRVGLRIGELLSLPFIYAGEPILAERGRWTKARVIVGMAVTQGVHVRSILFDPCACLIGSGNRPMTGDEGINVVSHVLEHL